VNKKTNFIIIQFDINYNSFDKSYLDFIEKICLVSVRKELNIPQSDKLKRNGTFSRWLYYRDGDVLKQSRIKIQTLLWTDVNGNRKYISAFPSFIIKYNIATTDLIEFISINVRKGEDIFKYIEDPENLVESEDVIIKACQKVDRACSNKGFAAQLSSKYTTMFFVSLAISLLNNHNLSLQLLKNTCVLLEVSKVCFESGILKHASLSQLNATFKFLR